MNTVRQYVAKVLFFARFSKRLTREVFTVCPYFLCCHQLEHQLPKLVDPAA